MHERDIWVRPGKDDVQQARMIDTFFRDADPELLRPTITPIGGRG